MSIANDLIDLLVSRGHLIPDANEAGVYRASNQQAHEALVFTNCPSEPPSKKKKAKETVDVKLLQGQNPAIEWSKNIQFSNKGTHDDYLLAANWWFLQMSQEYRDELEADFPAVDLASECKDAYKWLKGHSDRRRNSLNLFIRGWLRKAQQRAQWRNR